MKRARTLLSMAAVAAGLMVLVTTGAIASDFPSRPITMVIPFPPGGGTDQIMRVIGQEVSKSTGRPFIILNRGGAGGAIAAMQVKQAAPDGYTLFFGNAGTHAINPSVMKLDYDPKSDFAPVTHVMTFPHVLAVPAASPAKSVADLVAFARTKEGGANFATQGTGSGGQLLGEMLRVESGVPMTAVPYPGASPAILDTVTNRADFMFSSYAPVASFVEAGKLRVLAVTGANRLPALPDVPTLTEAGFPKVDLDYWFAVFAPAGTPHPIIDTLNGEFRRAGQTEGVQKIIETSGATLVMGSPEELAKLVAADILKLGDFVKKAQIKSK